MAGGDAADAAAATPVAAAAHGASGPDPRDGFAAKEPHSVRVLDSHMAEGLERDTVLVATAAVERHKQLKDVAMFVSRALRACACSRAHHMQHVRGCAADALYLAHTIAHVRRPRWRRLTHRLVWRRAACAGEAGHAEAAPRGQQGGRRRLPLRRRQVVCK